MPHDPPPELAVSLPGQTPSKKQVNKAGKLLRDWYSGRLVLASPSDTEHAFDLVTAYRLQWVTPPRPYPTTYARLFEMAQGAGSDHVVSRRLKRIDRMVLKLVRHPTMALTTMEDIAGCRVVVPGLDELHLFEDAVKKRWAGRLRRERDYVSAPRPTGYRALHLIVVCQGVLVEVQLRTQRQQEWAELVEFLEDRTGQLLKDGVGERRTLDTLRELSNRLADLDLRGVPPTDGELEGIDWNR